MDATSADLPVEDFTRALTGDVKGLRIGLPKEYFIEALGSEVRALVEASAEVLREQGAEIVEVSLPHTDYAVAVYYIVAPAEASANLARFDGVRYGFRHPDAGNVTEMYVKTKSEGFGPEVQRRIMLAPLRAFQQLLRRLLPEGPESTHPHQAGLRPGLQSATSSSPRPRPRPSRWAPSRDRKCINDIFTTRPTWRACRPISIPCGLSATGLPVGLQLIGKAFDEATVLRAAHCYEQHAGLRMGAPALV